MGILNLLDKGKCGSTTEAKRQSVGLPMPTEAQELLHRPALRESARLIWRRGRFGGIGVRAVAELAKISAEEMYGDQAYAPASALVAVGGPR